MFVIVTKEDIQSGSRINCFNCPIALAAKRDYGSEYSGFLYVVVGHENVSFVCEGYSVVWKQTKEMQEWRVNFDRGCGVEPSVFRLRQCDYVQGALA